MLNKCWYGGHMLRDMDYANFTPQEIREYEGGRPKPERCQGCDAMRRPQWVRRSLGGRGSGCWQWSLVFPHHTVVK
jgi:hypothetical protein